MFPRERRREEQYSIHTDSSGPQDGGRKLLPRCEVCVENAKYRCPRCWIRYCSSGCYKEHKRGTGCTGIRDRTAFIPLSKFNETDLQSDYRLLEEAANVVEKNLRGEYARNDRSYPLAPHLARLRDFARSKSGVDLQFLPEMFLKRRTNRTRVREGILNWTIALEIPQGDLSILKHNVTASTLVKDFIHDVLRDLTDSQKQKACALVNSSFNDFTLFLKAEQQPANDERYHQLDIDSSIAENLRGKRIIEFPKLWLSTRDHREAFPLVEAVETLTDRADRKLPSFFQEVDDSD